MKRIAAAVAGAAALGLTACTGTSAPTAKPGTVSVPVSCAQRYQAWDRGPGHGLIATFDAVSVAGAAGDTKMLTLALNKAKPALPRAAHDPVPACADPRGYWSVLLMHVTAAEDSIGSTSGLRAAVKDVPGIERQLTAELKQFIPD